MTPGSLLLRLLGFSLRLCALERSILFPSGNSHDGPSRTAARLSLAVMRDTLWGVHSGCAIHDRAGCDQCSQVLTVCGEFFRKDSPYLTLPSRCRHSTA